MHQIPPMCGVRSKHVTGRPLSRSALMTGRPQEPAPITHTLGRDLLMTIRAEPFLLCSELHEQQVLFRPDAGQPGPEPLAECGVVRVVALRHPSLDRALADVDDHPCEPPAAKIHEGGRPRPG